MSDWPISIRYEGKPQGKGRPRFGKGNTYTPEKTKLYENDLKWLAKAAMKGLKPLTGPVSLSMYAMFKGTGGEHPKKPDIDNIFKAVADALNEIVYIDDAQITDMACRKISGPHDRLEILVSPMKGLPDEPA